VIADQTIALDGTRSRQDYPVHLRRIRFRDPETGKTLVFLTNQTTLPASTICDLYKSRWKVELFFKWIKQHLRIKRFYGTSENAVKTQIWIAVSVYVLVAIVRKRLNIEASLYTLMQVFSVAIFEKLAIGTAFLPGVYSSEDDIGKRGKNAGTPAFFSCCGSTPYDSWRMCRFHPTSPGSAAQSLSLCCLNYSAKSLPWRRLLPSSAKRLPG
jgi:hypothetical protein